MDVLQADTFNGEGQKIWYVTFLVQFQKKMYQQNAAIKERNSPYSGK